MLAFAIVLDDDRVDPRQGSGACSARARPVNPHSRDGGSWCSVPALRRSVHPGRPIGAPVITVYLGVNRVNGMSCVIQAGSADAGWRSHAGAGEIMTRRVRIATHGVEVEAAQTTRGRAATTVSVEIAPAIVSEDVGALGDIEEVVAAVPVTEDGGVRWSEEHLDKVCEERATSRGPAKQTFAATHYGGSDSRSLGVRVALKCSTGTVLTKAGRHASHDVRQEDQADDEAHPQHGSRTRRRDG